MMFWRMTIVAMVLIFMARAAAANGPAACLVEQNFYYPKPGMADQALAIRKKGAEIRVQLGLPAGRVFIVEKATSGHPSWGKPKPVKTYYLTSITEYPDEQSFRATQQRLKESKEYLAVIGEMGGILKRFEQVTWRPVWGGCGSDGE